MAKKNPRKPNYSEKVKAERQRCLEIEDRIVKQKANPDYVFTEEDLEIFIEYFELLSNQVAELASGYIYLEEALEKRILKQKAELGIE